ncbi:tetratricopeptide repeat protein [Ramlibacter ginsenosidimutans]|uniref:Tetratricopeptide repeat protein n=1 Tax=Ramlibacter ginsenosidimutans TaxID=502333 RepID=A0A934TT59_9BURK|nr:tetratricopeptide repeat protein [Ramlibacter ginsenosidimutans]MBK6006913.1 tetratricopeptide repeat protein [Ramlibacter ginsenosidimutans]
MNQPASPPPSPRLVRLAGYLAQDPANAGLLAEACEEAMACGRHEQAAAYIESGERLAPGAAEWRFRLAQWSIATRDLARARSLLEELRASARGDAVLVHDLAYVRLLEGDAAAACELLQPLLDDFPPHLTLPPELAGRSQALWLRACHERGALDAAWAWTCEAQAAKRLAPVAAGVASLIALDLDELASARSLADFALQSDPRQPEALVARGSLALAARSPDEARGFLQQALARKPQDGRTLLAWGFACLLERDFPAACDALERAVQAMPSHAQSWVALGWTRLLLGETAGALAALRSAVQLDPADAQAHGALALAHAVSGDADGAAREATQGEAIDASDALCKLARELAHAAPGARRVEALLEALSDQWSPRA